MTEPIAGYEIIGSSNPDNLINQTSPSALTTGVELKADQGVLKRGTVLGYLETAGVLETSTAVKAIETTKVFYVLAGDVDTTGAITTGIAYTSGHFNRGTVNAATGITLSFEQENDLREKGIFLSDAKR